jgi:hypothetical protein
MDFLDISFEAVLRVREHVNLTKKSEKNRMHSGDLPSRTTGPLFFEIFFGMESLSIIENIFMK